MPRPNMSISSALKLAQALAQRELDSGEPTRRSPELTAAIEAVMQRIERAAGPGPDITALGAVVRRALGCR